MTYLFIVIGIAVINALSNKNTSYAELVTINSLIFAAALLKERVVGDVQQPTLGNKAEKAGRRRELRRTGAAGAAGAYTVQGLGPEVVAPARPERG